MEIRKEKSTMNSSQNMMSHFGVSSLKLIEV